jgi:hypothetical protein
VVEQLALAPHPARPPLKGENSRTPLTKSSKTHHSKERRTLYKASSNLYAATGSHGFDVKTKTRLKTRQDVKGGE